MINSINLINVIDEFNSNSLNKISLEFKRKTSSYYDISDYPNLVLPPNKDEFNFEIFNHNKQKECSIIVNDDYTDEAFKISKLMCNNANLRLEIHNNLISLNHCYSGIKQHKKQSIIKEHLAKYNPLILDKINSLNKQIKDNREQIELLFKQGGITLKIFRLSNDETLYNLN